MDKEQFWDDLKSGKFASMVTESSQGKYLFSSMDVFNVMKPIFADKDDVECMYCIFMNTKNKVIAIEKMTEGTINHSIFYPREIVKRVIQLKAASLILLHNHPSGDTEPSPQDEKITMKVGLSLSSIDVQLLDHIIIGNSYYSMADVGYIMKIGDRVKEFIMG
jgi:DNA repair protein RadC